MHFTLHIVIFVGITTVKESIFLRKCLGSREILGEEDEQQPNGKVKHNIYIRLRFGLVNVIGIFKVKNLCCVLITLNTYILFVFTIPNLSLLYFCMSEIFKTNVENHYLTTK